METSTGELIAKMMNLSNKLDGEMRFDESNLVLEVVAYMHAMTTRADNLRQPSYTDTRTELNNVVRFITGTNNEDIVNRLRDNCGCSGTDEFGYTCSSCNAADEIERLRADRDKWVEIAQLWDGAYSAQTYIHGLDEIETADMARKAQAKLVGADE